MQLDLNPKTCKWFSVNRSHTPLVIAAVNRKGGVGKTSTVFHLGGYYASLGYRVLLIDNDPQHSLTTGLMGPQTAQNCLPERTVTSLYRGQSSEDVGALIHETTILGISLVPGADEVARYNLPDPQSAGSLAEALRTFCVNPNLPFDIVLIDNPPNLQLCSWAALVAADAAVCVSQPEDYGSQGCVVVGELVADVQASDNPKLRMAGYLLNMMQERLSVHRAYEQLTRDVYGDLVFQSYLPLAAAFKEAITARTPVTLYRPRSKAALAVGAVAEELARRVGLGMAETNEVRCG